MLSFLKRKAVTPEPTPQAEHPTEQPTDMPRCDTPKKQGWFSRLTSGLSRTRSQFSTGLATLILGHKTLDDDLLEAIETHLLTADVGIDATQRILQQLTEQSTRKQLKDGEAILAALKTQLQAMLAPYSQALDTTGHHPFVILVVGVNGTGKTTTIGKLAKYYQAQGKSIMLAAGDTFRAAAIEQLQHWGAENDVPVIAQTHGADSAAVIFDALEAAKSRNIDILIADTAGRLHTKRNLMQELEKIGRVLRKSYASAPHETLMVLDASIGQNALVQAEHFNNALPLSGLAVTKLDGTAKGGMIFALTETLTCPIRFIGVGEGIDDLRPFDATEFVEALFTPTASS